MLSREEDLIKITMTKKIKIKLFMLSAIASLSVAGSALAQTSGSIKSSAPKVTDPSYGLLGANYVGVDFSYVHVKDSVLDNVNGFSWRYNQVMKQGFDYSLGFGYGRSNEVASWRATQKGVTASVTAYSDHNGIRPYIEPGVGWAWAKAGLISDDSFLYFVGTGVEFQVAKPLVVTPYVEFVDLTSFSGSSWNFGVKSAYRLNKNWGLHVDVSVDDDRNAGYSLGVNYHF